MNRKQNSGSGIFLMEMIVAVGFFIACAAVCMLAFAKADHMSRLAADRNRAVLAAQSMAEIWKLEGMDGVEVLERRLSAEKPELQQEVQVISDGNGLEQMKITMIRRNDGEELFTLESCRYVRPEGRADIGNQKD